MQAVKKGYLFREFGDHKNIKGITYSPSGYIINLLSLLDKIVVQETSWKRIAPK